MFTIVSFISFFIYFCLDLYDFCPSANFGFFVLLFPVILGINLDRLFEVFLVSSFRTAFAASHMFWGQEEKGMTEDEMARWHHQLDRHEFE